MLTDSEDAFIKANAYVPEHITGYVTAISGGEPFLVRDYLFYHINPPELVSGKGYLVFVGYPLNKPFEKEEMKEILDSVIERLNPEYVSIIAPAIAVPDNACSKRDSDHYYKLDISNFRLNQKNRNMINRASQELHIEKKQEIRDEHKLLISEFLRSNVVDDGTRHIFERIPEYISTVPTARVFSARDRSERLVAFDIADFGAKDYAFFMFNFMSRKQSVPGVSDLLLYEIIKAAKEQGRLFINLGLGIKEGVIFFKKKWGGVPFLNYEFCLCRQKRTGILKSFLDRL